MSDADYWAASVRQNALLNRVDLGLEFAMKFGSASDPREASDLDVAYHAAKLLLTKVDASDDSLEAALLSLQTRQFRFTSRSTHALPRRKSNWLGCIR